MSNKIGITYFLTNNLGGGGTNVSRFIEYTSLLNNSKIGLLLNYYYLNTNFRKPVEFDKKVLLNLIKYNDINKFIQDTSNFFALDLKKVSTSFAYTTPNWNPTVLLDSGSGNILRDISSNLSVDNSYIEIYKKIISEYHKFVDRLNIDMCIAFDFALKYTYKNNEGEDKIYQEIIQVFKNDIEKNHLLLLLTLQEINNNEYKQKVYAPLHGATPELFEEYLKKVLDTEKKFKRRFDGFAIGGIGDARRLNSKIWHIPDGTNSYIKTVLIISTLVKKLKKILKENNDTRPIHILGAGGIKIISPLIFSGISSFDCHTPWRRASDGNSESVQSLRTGVEVSGAEWSKFLVPLLNSKLEILPNKNVFSYQNINILENSCNCDCPVCVHFNMKTIKKLYKGDIEDNYFAKILLFIHAVWQYDFMIKKMEAINYDANVFVNFIKSIKDEGYKNDLLYCVDYLIKLG